MATGDGGVVDHVAVQLDPERGPEAHLRALVGSLEGDGGWEVEGAHVAWRARRHLGELTQEVGIGRMGPDTPWLVAWKVDPEVPEVLAFGSIAAALGVAGAAAAVGMAVGAGALTLVGAGVGLMGTLSLARRVVRSRLPATEEEARALGQRVCAALDTLPGARRL